MSYLDRGRKIAEEIGLIPHKIWGDPMLPQYYHQDDIHRLLGESVEVSGTLHRDGTPTLFTEPCTSDTHRAFIIAVRPVVQESDERKLLRDMVRASEYTSWDQKWSELMARAKALLSKEAGESPKLKR